MQLDLIDVQKFVEQIDVVHIMQFNVLTAPLFDFVLIGFFQPQ